ncbi:MAG: hydrogenase nickel incorporation protein HypB [Magnetococcales bacterium]|nr:hydrogenase nickel incorporation protein HypB [Magnetococcales bacterium]
MCETCGCGETSPHADPKQSQPDHDHDAPFHGEHTHDGHTHYHPPPARAVQVENDILAHNRALAESNRRWLRERGIHAINLISSPGAGKTTLLEKTLAHLQGRIATAVIVGDPQTDLDARRLRGLGARVEQIETVNACHLDAGRIQALLPAVASGETRLLFIENVGNLICPAAFDLGESERVVLLSTPEGEDKPLKYPIPFVKAQLVLVTKSDLATLLPWNRDHCLAGLRRVNPSAPILELSAMTGAGMEAWFHHLELALRQPG